MAPTVPRASADGSGTWETGPEPEPEPEPDPEPDDWVPPLLPLPPLTLGVTTTFVASTPCTPEPVGPGAMYRPMTTPKLLAPTRPVWATGC